MKQEANYKISQQKAENRLNLLCAFNYRISQDILRRILHIAKK